MHWLLPATLAAARSCRERVIAGTMIGRILSNRYKVISELGGRYIAFVSDRDGVWAVSVMAAAAAISVACSPWAGRWMARSRTPPPRDALLGGETHFLAVIALTQRQERIVALPPAIEEWRP